MANELRHVTVGTELTQAEYESVTGHAFASQATGDILYASSATQLTRLGIGAANAVLNVSGGIPAWTNTPTVTGLTVGDVSFSEATPPAGTIVSIYRDNTGDLTLNALTDKTVNLAIAGVDVAKFAAATLTLVGAQTLTTSTNNLTLATAAGNGNISLTPNGTGHIGLGVAATTTSAVSIFPAATSWTWANATGILTDWKDVQTINDTSATTSRNNMALLHLGGYTLTATEAMTYVNMAGFRFGAPIPSTNVTITYNWGAFSYRGGLFLGIGQITNVSSTQGVQLHIQTGAVTTTHATGTEAILATTSFGIVTYNNTGTGAGNLTATALTTVYIPGAPVRGTNVLGSGALYSLFVDAGAVRLDGSLWVESTPTEGTAGEQLTSGGAATVMTWDAAGCLLEAKENPVLWKNPKDALNAILGTHIYQWHYKRPEDRQGIPGMSDLDTVYVGPMAQETPWAMHYQGRILNPVNAFGYTVLAFQAMQAEIDSLKAELTALKG